MNGRWLLGRLGLALLAVGLATGVALAHITPPVVLVSDREAVLGLTAGARRYFVRDVRLGAEERAAIKKDYGWSPEEDAYRFYVGRDDQGRLVSAVTFVTEVTVHGPVRVAVAVGSDGKVKGATVVELTEETYGWVKPLIDEQFARDYVGQDPRGRFALSERVVRTSTNPMSQFYGQVIASLVQRGLIIYDVTVAKRGDKAA